MKKVIHQIAMLSVFVFVMGSCRTQLEVIKIEQRNELVDKFGRYSLRTEGIVLHSSASGIGFKYTGTKCGVKLQNLTQNGDYHYVVVELDGKYYRKYKVDGQAPIDIIIETQKGDHNLKIFKATESQNGEVAIVSIEGKDIAPIGDDKSLKIEFIGNSITCAMGNDVEIPCGTDKWYDQHNAYYSYASITARALDASMLISAVSGSGIYRNWNSDGPTIPQVYENLDMSFGQNKKRNFNQYRPDLITICLGTNDMSNGDGVKQREKFDRQRFILEYVAFVEELKIKYPEANMLLMTSPMVGGDRGEELKSCLQSIQNKVNKTSATPIDLFSFSEMQPSGCSGHPILEDHIKMSEELIAYIQSKY